jgi:hypothetical protein
VSLTRDGTILTYDSSGFVKAIRTSSPPGPAATYSRTLVDVARYGRSDWSTFAAITPDGKRLYFNVVPETNRGPGAGQVRVAVVGSDRSRLVAAGTQYNGLMFTDPHVRHVLLYGRNRELGDLDLRSGEITPFPGRLRRWIGEVFW